MVEINAQSEDLRFIVDIAKKAGEIGMHYFRAENKIWYKQGNSPVSQADQEIDDYLKMQFESYRSGYGWLSEETEDGVARLQKHRVAIVDPIDGTRGFINGQKEWCISIAIVENGQPKDAVLHCPALKETFAASKTDGLLLENVEPKAHLTTTPLLVTGSKKLIETIDGLNDLPLETSPFIPSLAYRLALVATGQLDGAFARSGASEWDIVAADLILKAADCKLTDKEGRALTYNKKQTRSPALVSAHSDNFDRILGLAKSSGILH